MSIKKVIIVLKNNRVFSSKWFEDNTPPAVKKANCTEKELEIKNKLIEEYEINEDFIDRWYVTKKRAENTVYITIEANAELSTSDAATITAIETLVFQTNEADEVGSAQIDGTINVTGQAYLEMKITSARWHIVVLPSNVNTEDVLVDGVSNKFRQSNGWLMRAFDATGYANGTRTSSNGWYNVTSATTMKANVGYLVGLKHGDSEVHTLSFPITVGAQNTDLMVSTTAATGSQSENK